MHIKIILSYLILSYLIFFLSIFLCVSFLFQINIDLTRCQEFVDCYNSWIEKQDDTNDVVKQKDLKFDPIKFKTFIDEFKTLLSLLRGSRGITLEYVIRDSNTQTGPPIEVPSQDVNSNEILSHNSIVPARRKKCRFGTFYEMMS